MDATQLSDDLLANPAKDMPAADVDVARARQPRSDQSKSQTTRRVVHVINGEHYSGAERVQDLLALHLAECGYEVQFACVKPGRFPSQRASQATVLYEIEMSSRFDLRAARRLADRILADKVDLLHAHTPRSALIAALAARRTGTPFVYHVHSPTVRDSTSTWHNRFNALVERVSLKNVDRMIAVSPSLKLHMEKQGYPAEKLVYVPNGVPAVPVVIPRSRPQATWTLGMIALFRPRKGIEVLLDAMAAMLSRGHDVRLRAVGPFETPRYEAEIKQRATRLGLADRICWCGFASDMEAEWKQCDVFVLPSLFGEGMPMVLLEAMAAGVPVVASQVDGVPEAIRHGADGLLVAPGSVSQLSMAVEDLIQGTFDYEVFSQRAHQRHAERFSASVMAESVSQVYDDVLGGAGGGGPLLTEDSPPADVAPPAAVR